MLGGNLFLPCSESHGPLAKVVPRGVLIAGTVDCPGSG